MTNMEIRNLKAESAESHSEVSSPTLSVGANYAEHWYADALAEVKDSADSNNKRREIVFSTCFLESYIYEWVRNYGTHFVTKYFSETAKTHDGDFYAKGLKNKWKYIPSEIAKELGLVQSLTLDLSGLGELIKFRNGLVHAKASKFYNAFTEKSDQPVPSQEELEGSIKTGWAISVASKLVTSLHEKLNSDVPNYLKRKP